MEGKRECRNNPFLNHLIINKIISCTSRISELKALRLISTQWNDLTSPKLLQNSIVTFKSQKEIDLYIKLFKSTVPHLNFHWKATGVDLNDQLMKLVLISAKELHISKGLITSEDLMEILNKGEHLKTLSFNEVFIEKENSDEAEKKQENESAIESSISEGEKVIVNNLTRLEVTSCDKDDNFPWNTVLPKLPKLRVLHAQLQSTSQVTNLLESMLEHQVKLEEFSCFLVDMNEHHLELLACLEMPLKILDISLASTVTNSAVEGLLSSNTCKYLENLKLFKEADCGHKNYFGLPKMTNLKSLEILGDPVAKIFKTISSSCPKLESINLSEVSCRDVMAQNFQHLKLKSLCIEECFFPTNVLSRLAETFPFLTKLALFLNDENVATVFQKFTELEELTVLGTEISDDGITGGRHHSSLEELAENTRAYIGDCKKLRSFNLYPQPLIEVTDASIHCGLLFVPELTSLTAPETAISDKGLRTLIRAKPNMVKLYAKVVIDPTTNEHFLRSSKYQLL